MWLPTKVEAVEMYARHWAARFGTAASKSAREMAASLEQMGDADGHKAWNDVAEVIERRERDKRGTTHQESVTAAS
jgi:hypothetical protein